MAIKKTISIPEDQAEWVDDNDKSLSKITQRAIQDEMEKAKKTK